MLKRRFTETIVVIVLDGRLESDKGSGVKELHARFGLGEVLRRFREGRDAVAGC